MLAHPYLLATLSNNSLPADQVATSGAMFLRFDSNPGRNREGFTATWSTSDGCSAENVADNFNSASFSQNDGTQNWATDWLEVAEADGPSAGIVRVNNSNCSNGNCLRIGVVSGDPAQTYNNIGVQREVNLSGATSATLTFNYRTGYASGTPLIRLWVSNNGGVS